jgi:hypothetical protein
MEMPAAIRPYSMAVAPDSSRRKAPIVAIILKIIALPAEQVVKAI